MYCKFAVLEVHIFFGFALLCQVQTTWHSKSAAHAAVHTTWLDNLWFGVLQLFLVQTTQPAGDRGSHTARSFIRRNPGEVSSHMSSERKMFQWANFKVDIWQKTRFEPWTKWQLQQRRMLTLALRCSKKLLLNTVKCQLKRRTPPSWDEILTANSWGNVCVLQAPSKSFNN